MTFFEALVALLTTTTAAGAAGVLVASGAVDAAGASDHLPDPPDHMVVEVVETPADNETEPAIEAAETEEPSEEAGLQDVDAQGVAGAVHEALTGDPDVAPGDPDFGATVAQRAREGGAAFGVGVANAASDGEANPGGDDVDDPDLEGETTNEELSGEEDAPEGSATGHDRRSTFSPHH